MSISDVSNRSSVPRLHRAVDSLLRLFLGDAVADDSVCWNPQRQERTCLSKGPPVRPTQSNSNQKPAQGQNETEGQVQGQRSPQVLLHRSGYEVPLQHGWYGWQLANTQCCLSLISAELVCRFSSFSGRNVRRPCRMLPRGESRWVCRRERQTDVRTDTRLLHYAIR